MKRGSSKTKVLRWLQVRPGDFGSLGGEIALDPDKLTVVVGDNEAGKSTLVAALLAVMYNVNHDKRRLKTDPRPSYEDYRPWSGGVCSVELELLSDGVLLLVHRDFDNRVLKVLQNGEVDITPDYDRSRNRDALGQALTGGLTPDGFLRSFLISQEQASLVSEPGELVNKIQAVVTAAPGDTTIRQALDLLGGSLKKVDAFQLGFSGPVQVKTALNRFNEEINSLESRRDQLDKQSEEASAAISELTRKEDRRDKLKREIEGVHKGQLIAEKEDLEERLNSRDDARGKLVSLEGEAQKLKEYKDFPLDSLSRFESACGGYHEAQEQAKAASETVERHRDRYESEKKNLSEFHDLEGMDETALDSLRSDLEQWKSLKKKLERHGRNLEEEKGRLAAEGVFAHRLESVREKIATWPETVFDEFDALKGELVQAEDRRREVDEWLSRHEFPRSGFRLTPKFIMIFLVALLASFGAAFEWKLAENTGWALVILGVAVSAVVILALLEHFSRDKARRRNKQALSQSKAEESRCDAKLRDFCLTLGEDDPEEVAGILADGRKIAGRGDEFFRLKTLYTEAESELRAVTDRLRPHLERAGVVASGDLPTSGDIEGFSRRLNTYRTVYGKLRELAQELLTAEEHARDAAERIAKPWNELKSLMDAAGVPFGDNSKAAMDDYRQRAEKARKLREIEEKIERLKKDASDDDSINNVRNRLREVEEKLAQFPDGEAVPGSTDELRSREEELAGLLRDVEREIQSDRLRLGKLTDELPEERRKVRERLHYLLGGRETLTVQKEAVELAAEVMNETERDVFGNAAKVLNARLGPVLSEITPRWRSTTFDQNLHLHAVDAETGRKLLPDELERVLSAGARDALFLGARMALSDFLSKGVIDAPFLLDEPFAHLDDDHFSSGMRLLLERVGEGKQVIVLTCHRERHELWRDSLDKSVREQVRWVELEERSA